MEVVMRTRIEVVHLIASRVLDENNWKYCYMYTHC
jgi:hypothetical protein